MLKQKIRVIFKSIIIKMLMLLYRLYNLFRVNKKFDINAIDKIVILHKKPLGLGDMVMLSPLYLLIIKNIEKKVYIVSEYDKFLDFKTAIWKKPSEVSSDFFSNAIVISPTLALPHLKYILYSKFYIGYFISNKLICNFSKIKYEYNAINEHYLEKVFIILDILSIEYKKDNFEYPKVITQKLELPENYIVIAPYANWEERQYPKDRYIALINKLLNKTNYDIVIVGSNNNIEIEFNLDITKQLNNNKILNLSGKTALKELNYILMQTKLYIGNDAGPSNIAYISAKKILVFFGSVFYENRLPLNSQIKKNIVALDDRNSCIQFPCFDGYNKPVCYNEKQYSCLDIGISEKQLFNIIRCI